MSNYDSAISAIREFGIGRDLTHRISSIESNLRMTSREDAIRTISDDDITAHLLESALAIKAVAGQINVIVHAVGVLHSLPYILANDEVVISLSLGAGNTGRNHDLETDQQIAEFKFIDWKGGPESIRQNSLFLDIFNLATADTRKRRVLYLTGKSAPMRFLYGGRAISSVLSRNIAARRRFDHRYGNRFRIVREYFRTVEELVEIVDLQDFVPVFARTKEISRAADH